MSHVIYSINYLSIYGDSDSYSLTPLFALTPPPSSHTAYTNPPVAAGGEAGESMGACVQLIARD